MTDQNRLPKSAPKSAPKSDSENGPNRGLDRSPLYIEPSNIVVQVNHAQTTMEEGHDDDGATTKN